ncbi:MAG: hypothetical protein U1E76_23210 [Planctomycetota bacterium]
MLSLMSLWMPIVLSAVLVFVASSIIHMVLGYHKRDCRGLANEDEVRAAIRKGNPAPGFYVLPYCTDMKQLAAPAMQQKFIEGPVGLLTVKRAGVCTMGPMLVQWFVYSLLISFSVAYVASRTLAAGTDYLHVFRVAGTVAWLAYAGGTIPPAIWMGKPWSVAIKDLIDGLVYGLVTAGAFGWLWPR